MVTKCAVVGCRSEWNPFTMCRGISFHRVTKDKKLLPLWLRVVDIKLYNNAKICSLHFRPEDLEDCRGAKRVKSDAVPAFRVPRDEADHSDEDDDDNKNLLTLKKLLTSDTNDGTAADDYSDDEHPRHFEVVKISSCSSTTCNSLKTQTEKPKEIKSTGTQVNRPTDGEIVLRQQIKMLRMRLKRRDAKISSMKTVFNMIKKNVKGTDMEYRLSCELQNISNFSEPIRSSPKKNTQNKTSARPESPVSECNNDDEESSADENGMFCEVTLSPNLRVRNGVKF